MSWLLRIIANDIYPEDPDDPRRKLPPDSMYDQLNERKPPLGDRIFQHHGVWQYPFNEVKRHITQGWYLDWFGNPGSIHDINSVQPGDKVADNTMNMTPYWEVTGTDEETGRIYVNPIDPNPWLTGVGALGQEFTQHDFDVQSGDFEKQRVDSILDMINTGQYTDPNDIAYILLGTVPVHIGPNRSQGGWYAVTDTRSNRGGQQDMSAKEIMMKDAESLKRLGFDIPESALNGSLPPEEFKYVIEGGLPYKSRRGDNSKNIKIRQMLQLEGENFEDIQATRQMILEHPQPSIKKRNWHIIMEQYHDLDDNGKEEMKIFLKDLCIQISKLSHPNKNERLDHYWHLKENAILLSARNGWTDVLEMYENTVDSNNRKDIASAYRSLDRLDKLEQLEEDETHPEVLKEILYAFYKSKKNGTTIIDKNPNKYRQIINYSGNNSTFQYHADELAKTPVWVIDFGSAETSQRIDQMHGALLSVEQYLEDI